MIIKHYYDFGKKMNNKISKNGNGKKLSQAAWDLLRTESEDGAFAFLEKDENEYASMCAGRTDCRDMAQNVLDILKKNGIREDIISLGCGKGILEWNLKNLKPELYIECTDYTSKGINYLRKVFPECNAVYEFDMLNGNDYKRINRKDQVVLLNRVSTEFDFRTWKKIFEEIFQNELRYILFIPTEICTFRIALNEMKSYIYHLLMGKGRIRNIFCGYMYSERTFEKMWKNYFKIRDMKMIAGGVQSFTY